jgi:hypothetical protein
MKERAVNRVDWSIWTAGFKGSVWDCLFCSLILFSFSMICFLLRFLVTFDRISFSLFSLLCTALWMMSISINPYYSDHQPDGQNTNILLTHATVAVSHHKQIVFIGTRSFSRLRDHTAFWVSRPFLFYVDFLFYICFSSCSALRCGWCQFQSILTIPITSLTDKTQTFCWHTQQSASHHEQIVFTFDSLLLLSTKRSYGILRFKALSLFCWFYLFHLFFFLHCAALWMMSISINPYYSDHQRDGQNTNILLTHATVAASHHK